MYIPGEIIESIREKAHIEELIKKYVPTLTKKGKNYIGLCPFHNEKTPSFTVSPEKQIFHCFGCKEGGNVFSFIKKIERLDFLESVKLIAEYVGIEIKDESKENYSELDIYKRINNYAANVYHKYIKSTQGKNGYDYLINRGITDESIDDFKLGFAPDSWNFITNSLKKLNINLSLAENIGIINSKQKQQEKHYYDRYRDRVIFPILDIKGDTIAFGGRILGKGDQKYINSPESQIFKKRNVLYGLHKARDHIRELNRAIIVEGYLDVIGCHQAGIKNVVAPLGTALTSTQLISLSRHCKEIIILFDADLAGLKAALRTVDAGSETNLDIKIALLPEGDPFDFILQKGIREFMVIIDSAMDPIDFKISRVISGPEDDVRKLLQLFPIIQEINLETERSLYLKKISTQLGMNEKDVRKDFQNFVQKDDNNLIKSKPKIDGPVEKNDYFTRGYRDLIKLLCNYPKLIEKAVIDFSAENIDDNVTRKIYTKIIELYGNNNNFSVDKLFDHFDHGEEMKILNDSISIEHAYGNPDSVYTEIYINMKLYDIDKKINKYAEMIRKSDLRDSQKYLAEVEVLRREKQKLSNYIYYKGVGVK